MKIEVNITKKYFLVLLTFILAVAGGFVVYAATAPTPVGHTGSQINVDCPDGQNDILLESCLDSIKYTGGGAVSSGQYVGDGSIGREFLVGFKPNYIIISWHGSTNFENVGCELVGSSSYTCGHLDEGSIAVISPYIIPLSTGFRLDTTLPNHNGQDYVYVAFG